MNMYMHYPYYFGGGFFMVLFWLALILIVFYIIQKINEDRSERRGGAQKSALDILKERYAKGEIEKSEFEEKKKNLKE